MQLERRHEDMQREEERTALHQKQTASPNSLSTSTAVKAALALGAAKIAHTGIKKIIHPDDRNITKYTLLVNNCVKQMSLCFPSFCSHVKRAPLSNVANRPIYCKNPASVLQYYKFGLYAAKRINATVVSRSNRSMVNNMIKKQYARNTFTQCGSLWNGNPMVVICMAKHKMAPWAHVTAFMFCSKKNVNLEEAPKVGSDGVECCNLGLGLFYDSMITGMVRTVSSIFSSKYTFDEKEWGITSPDKIILSKWDGLEYLEIIHIAPIEKEKTGYLASHIQNLDEGIERANAKRREAAQPDLAIDVEQLKIDIVNSSARPRIMMDLGTWDCETNELIDVQKGITSNYTIRPAQQRVTVGPNKD